MVVTKEVDLPLYETLTVQEVNLSTSALMTAAPYLGKQCEGVNSEFMLCRQETNDARACVELGKGVTCCAMQVFMNIKKSCHEEFNQYLNCIDKSSGDFGYRHCRKTQAVFDNCMDEKMHVKRPDFGYFCRGRVHKSKRLPPVPPPCPCYPKFQDATPSLPDCKERKPARFTSRLFWVTE
ncbi:NADH:ubiquinone dehydrogenase [Operophtera brumata]|uniref:NADH:ubiquinone dehydrogenase n=1 Tax=Operophtera brumata TaxID=104452 RepID=A0A0L7LEF3_OPEBR|nr:NADH:ubiquinone dehydrogenase [Operophtera brumata]